MTSPYLLRPLRTYDEALREIEKRRRVVGEIVVPPGNVARERSVRPSADSEPAGSGLEEDTN